MQTINGGRATGRGTQHMAGFASNPINHRLALIRLNIKHSVVQFITQAQSIKVDLIFALQELGLLGQPHLIIAHQIHPHAKHQRKHKQ
jgi:hypothetical protein